MMLSAARGMALIRIGFGLYYFSQVYDKVQKHWLTSGDPMTMFIKGQLPHSTAGYKSFLSNTVLPNAGLFSTLVTLGEITATVLLVLGLFTRAGALVGIFLNLNYMLCKGITLPGGSVDRLFILTDLVLLLTAAGLVWGLDGVLQNATGRIPVIGWFTGASRGTARPAIGD